MFFKVFGPQRCQKLIFKHFFSVGQKSSKTCFERLKNIPGCLETILGWSGDVLAKLKNSTFEKKFSSILAYFYAIFQAVELTQNVATDLERKKNDLAKRCGKKLRTYMYIAP